MEVLGKQVDYRYSEPNIDTLETFNNPVSRPYEIAFVCHEFTSLCPITGQPDYAKVRIKYLPKHECVETKSLKLYLVQYRMYKGFMEEICNRIARDIDAKLAPLFCEVTMSFSPRGGISGRITCKR